MLKKTIQSDTTNAMKNGESFTLGVLRMLLASVQAKEKEKKYKEKLAEDAELSEDEIISVIISEIKKRKDAIALYEKGNRPELAEKEKNEIGILKKYLPEQLSEEELKKLVAESIEKVKAEMKDPSASSGQVMGKVMADLNPKIKGKADSGEANKIVKELLSK